MIATGPQELLESAILAITHSKHWLHIYSLCAHRRSIGARETQRPHFSNAIEVFYRCKAEHGPQRGYIPPKDMANNTVRKYHFNERVPFAHEDDVTGLRVQMGKLDFIMLRTTGSHGKADFSSWQ